MIDPSKLNTTRIIRLNEGMLRDCWYEQDKESDDFIFVIRQVNLADAKDSSGHAKVKEFRLTESECKTLFSVLNEKLHRF